MTECPGTALHIQLCQVGRDGQGIGGARNVAPPILNVPHCCWLRLPNHAQTSALLTSGEPSVYATVGLNLWSEHVTIAIRWRAILALRGRHHRMAASPCDGT